MNDRKSKLLQLHIPFNEEQSEELFTCLKDVYKHYILNNDLQGIMRVKNVLERLSVDNHTFFPSDGM